MDTVKASVKDAEAIHGLILQYSKKGIMLPRQPAEVFRHIREFYVCRDEDGVAGCASLQVVWEDLAEIRSLAVDSNKHGRGVGRSLVEVCVEEARVLGIPTVFVLTYESEFFARFGFRLVDKSELPHKIWSDCVVCPKFPDCDEKAMKLTL